VEGRGEGKGERRGREGREVDTPNIYLDRRLCYMVKIGTSV